MATFTWKPKAADELADLAADYWETNSLPTVVQAIKASAPIDSGMLRDNVHADGGRTGSGRRTVFKITSRAVSEDGFNYPQVVVLGRGPVYPKAAKALRWVGRNGTVFAKSAGPAHGNNYLFGGLSRSRLIRPRRLS